MTRFEAVKRELVARFGPDDGHVNFSPIPLYLDAERGMAESLAFRQYIPGVAYCTCPISLFKEQKPGPSGHYELMMCTREKTDFIPQAIGQLAKHTFKAVLKPGDTMDLGPAQRPARSCAGCYARSLRSRRRLSGSSCVSAARYC